MAKKNRMISVQGKDITIIDDDYISLTDMLKAKDGEFFISDWLRNRNTVEFMGIWEQIHNPIFNYGEFATIRSKVEFVGTLLDLLSGGTTFVYPWKFDVTLHLWTHPGRRTT